MKHDINDVHRYDDIINLPHHISKSHLQMTTHDRAAQFSPFAALTGYDGVIKETARITDKRIEPDEAAKSVLDEKLKIIKEQLGSQPEITITYFQQDVNKEGGTYISTTGIIKKINSYERTVALQDGTRIAIEDIINITGEIVQPLDDFG